ncbi:hypothetical protein KR067_009964 [Drosophila pandora]|nr:hypothetical protein KR067_009964 [Drosophila pandora]
MVNRLTEQLVEAKSKCSDYRSAVKLNVWGSDLDDISICLQMPRLEVLALSVNRISSLSSLQNCHRLKELYLRKNVIQSFEELNYLKNAHELSSLWMEGNPCSDAAGETYRACVLRKLPQLKKLDDVEVRDMELQSALRHEYYPEPKSTITSSPVPEPPNSPKVKACRERLEREREFEREMERERERELEREREQERNRDRSRELAAVELEREAYPTESAASSPRSRRSPVPEARFSLPPPTEIHSPVNRRAGGDGSPGDSSLESSPRLSNDHLRRCIPPNFHPHQLCTRSTAATVASAASAAAAAAMMAQTRQEAMEALNRRRADDIATVGQRDRLMDSRPYDMVASVSPQTPSPLGVTYYAGIGVAGGAVGSSNSSSSSSGGSNGSGSNGGGRGLSPGSAEHQRRLRTNSNLLSATLCLIREMDAPTLEALSHAIHDHVTSQSMPY